MSLRAWWLFSVMISLSWVGFWLVFLLDHWSVSRVLPTIVFNVFEALTQKDEIVAPLFSLSLSVRSSSKRVLFIVLPVINEETSDILVSGRLPA